MMKLFSTLFCAVILVSAPNVFAETDNAQTPDMAAADVQEASLQQRYTLNRIAASVNGDVILTSELNAAVKTTA